MVTPSLAVALREGEDVFAPVDPIAAERDFYRDYDWCLNPDPTAGEALAFLRAEVGKFGRVPDGWQTQEVALNVYLLACAVLNSIDEHLRGPSLRVPRMPS